MKGLFRRTTFDKVLRDKAFNIVKNPKDNGYQRGIASIVHNCFYKKSEGDGQTGTGISSNSGSENQRPLVLAKQLHKPNIKNVKIVKYTF